MKKQFFLFIFIVHETGILSKKIFTHFVVKYHADRFSTGNISKRINPFSLNLINVFFASGHIFF